VSLEHTLFLDFLKLFVNMRLALSFARKKKFVFFGPMDQKLWVFEVSRRSLGRAGMCWSQPTRVDHLHKKWRAGRKNFKKNGNCPTGAGVDPRVDTCACGAVQSFLKFFNLKKRNFWKFG
jgi:hypothetical protein